MSKRILVIDDDPAFREMVRTALIDAFPEIDIDEARDGYIGEKRLRKNKYDMILLDYKLPFGMNGLRFLERSADLRLDTPLIMITAEGNEHVAATAFRLGATDYLVKSNNVLNRLVGMAKDILEREAVAEDHRREGNIVDERHLVANLNTANSGIELVKQYQQELNCVETSVAIRGDTMLMEFGEIGEFNKFIKLVKFLRGVNIKDTKILDRKYILLLSLMPTRIQRIGATSG